MNEGLRLRWSDCGRLIPFFSAVFKIGDSWCAFRGMTMVEREYRSGLGRPCLREEYLELLQAVHDAQIIDDAEYRKRVLDLPKTGFVNLKTLEFMRRECPDGFANEFGEKATGNPLTYKRILRELRWERDSDINPMNYGLALRAVEAKAITEQELRQDMFWHMLRRPVPWALELAEAKEYIPRGRYLVELRLALCRLDRKLAQEAYEAGLIEAPKRDEMQRNAEQQQVLITTLLRCVEKPTGR